MTTTRDKAVFILISLLAIYAMGCTPQSTAGLHHLTATQASTLIEKNSGNPDFVILDVRTPREFRQGHLRGAVLLDFHSPKFSSRLQKLDRSKTYLVYCQTGYRSSRTVEMIEKMGFNTVYHLQRGIVEWYGQKLPLTRS